MEYIRCQTECWNWWSEYVLDKMLAYMSDHKPEVTLEHMPYRMQNICQAHSGTVSENSRDCFKCHDNSRNETAEKGWQNLSPQFRQVYSTNWKEKKHALCCVVSRNVMLPGASKNSNPETDGSHQPPGQASSMESLERVWAAVPINIEVGGGLPLC